MKFKNEYIIIKTDKEVVLHNYIYDSYLELFSKSQYKNNLFELEMLNNNKSFYACFIKLDTPIEDIKNATKDDFDLALYEPIKNVNGNINSVTTVYNFISENNKIYNLKEYRYEDLNLYKNRKITAIGFGVNYVMACVDTSNYNINIIEEETLSISRKDKMTTDGECVGIDLPLHIAPTSNRRHILESEAIYVPVWAKLYSIGFGSIKGMMEEEFIIGRDIQVIEENNLEFGFNLLKGFEQSIYLNEELQPSDELYPMPIYQEEEIHPLQELYPNDELYPIKANYKYIIYKYRLYYIDTMQDALIELDEYYTLNYYDDKTKGLFEIKTKIERKE